MKKNILAIETSTAACSVALRHNGQLYVRNELLPQKHAQRLLEMVNEVLGEAGITGESLDMLAYGEGPGAFTGIRIAAGVIQGLALGWDKPVMPISSLEAMVQAVFSLYKTEDKKAWCAVMDARMAEVYFLTGYYTPQGELTVKGAVALLSPEEALEAILTHSQSCVGVGEVIAGQPGLVDACTEWVDALPTAEGVLLVAERKASTGHSLRDQVPLPVYLRNNIADTTLERAHKKMLKESVLTL